MTLPIAGSEKKVQTDYATSKGPRPEQLPEEPAVFDLMVDPEEKNNLHGDPGQAEVVASLMEALNRWWSP